MSKSRGFTIIELLVVLAVMGVFAAIAYPNIMSWITDREVKKEDSYKQIIHQILTKEYGRSKIIFGYFK